MRNTAFADADLIIVLGTRMNYIIGRAAPPRFGGNAKIARIDIDATEISHRRTLCRYPHCRRLQDGAAATVDGIKGKVTQDSYKAWRQKLAESTASRMPSDNVGCE